MSPLRSVGGKAVDPAPGGTRIACIIGWPVAHSLSPAIQNAAFQAAEIDWAYVALPVAPDDVADAINGIRALGIVGANVTMPHKRAVMEHLDEVGGEAERIGAVNTIVRSADRLIGANTDGAGFVRFLERAAGMPDGPALILGAGGAARAVGVALADSGIAVTIAARDPQRGEEAREAVGGTLVDFQDAAKVAKDAVLIVNATPLGHEGDGVPLDVDAIEPRHTIIDLVYAPPETRFLMAARERGARTHNGLGMLIEQAALSFELWTGRPAPREAMSAAALRAIATKIATE